ncbi:MAG: hypothetical protein ABSH35_10150 [Isosphaeraceae bacterium]
MRSWQPRLPTPMKPRRTWSPAPSIRAGASVEAAPAAAAVTAAFEKSRRLKPKDMAHAFLRLQQAGDT